MPVGRRGTGRHTSHNSYPPVKQGDISGAEYSRRYFCDTRRGHSRVLQAERRLPGIVAKKLKLCYRVFKTERRMAVASYPFGWECCKPSEPSIETNVRFASSTGLIRVRRPRKWSTTSSQFSGTEKVVLDQGKRQDSWLGRGYHSQAD